MTDIVTIGSGWTDEHIGKHKDRLPDMRSMMFYGSRVSDKGVEMLSACRNLQELHLMGTSITDKALEHIGELTSLRWLALDAARVTDKGIEQLTSLKKLNGLHLVETDVTAKGLEVLFNFPELNYLEATGLDLGKTGFSTIANQPALHVLRVASRTANDTEFLDLGFSRSLLSVSYDLPRVTKEAEKELNQRLKYCQLMRMLQYEKDDRFMPLLVYCVKLYRQREYNEALTVVNELMAIVGYHPACLGMRAFIHLRLGAYRQYRDDLIEFLSATAGDVELVRLGLEFIATDNYLASMRLLDAIKPEVIILKTLNMASMKRNEPFASLQRKLYDGRDRLVLPFARAAASSGESILRRAAMSNFADIESVHDDYIKQPKPELVLLQKIKRISNKYEDTEESSPALPWQW